MPTQTPLPMGHRLFDVSHPIAERVVRHGGTVHECW